MTMNLIQWNSNRVLLIGLVAGGLGLFIVYNFWGKGGSMQSLKTFSTWKTHPFDPLPDKIKKDMKDIKLMEGLQKLTVEGQEIQIFSRESVPKGPAKDIPVLLLHGQAFTSQNWVDTQTLQMLGAMGHRAIAIDLPGYGKSKGAVENKAGFLANFIEQHDIHRPVIISPSMSGTFSLPYILEDPAKCTERARGFVPVAPAGTGDFTSKQYKECHVPTMFVYGSNDKSLGPRSRDDLQFLPDNEVFPIDGAGHPAYLDKPNEWHVNLYNFMLAMERVKE